MPVFDTQVDVDHSEPVKNPRVAGVHPVNERGKEYHVLDSVDAPVQLGVDQVW